MSLASGRPRPRRRTDRDGDRPEDLLARDAHVVVTPSKTSARRRSRGSSPSGRRPPATTRAPSSVRDVDVLLDLLELPAVTSGRPSGSGPERVADADRVGLRREAPDELVVDGGVHERARGGHARLAGGGEDPVGDRRTACSRSASAKTMFGDLPPSSNVTSFSVLAARAAIRLPVAVEPVKAILSTPAWSTSAAPARAPEARAAMLSDARRQLELLDQRREHERRDGRVVGGLEDDRIAAGQRRADLPGEHVQRRVPGDDRADDADRLASRVGEERPRLGHRVAEHVLADAGEELEVAHDDVDLGARLAHRLAVVARLDRGRALAVGVDDSAIRHSSRARSGARVRPHGPSIAARAAATARSTSCGPASATCAHGSPVAGS